MSWSGLINSHSTLAVGLSGEDGGLFTAERRGTVVDGEEVDLGLVGDVVAVGTEAIEGLIGAGSVPGGGEHRTRRATAWCTTSTPTPPRPRWPWRCGPSGWSCSPTSKGCTATGRAAPR